MSSRNTRGSSAEEVVQGSRVTVLNGRHFPAFRAGDEGVVLSVDEEAQTCQVEFSGRPRNQPVQVALRHLQVKASAAAAGQHHEEASSSSTGPPARRTRLEPPETTICGEDPASLPPPRGRPCACGGGSAASSSSVPRPETHVLGLDPNSLPPWTRQPDLGPRGEDPRSSPPHQQDQPDQPYTSHIYARPDTGERMGPGHNYTDWLDELGVAVPDDSLGTSDFGPRFGSSAGDADSPTARRAARAAGATTTTTSTSTMATAASGATAGGKRAPPPLPAPASAMSQSPSWPDEERSKLSYQSGSHAYLGAQAPYPGNGAFNGYSSYYGAPQGAEMRIAQLESELIRQQEQYQTDVDSLRHALDESVQALATCASAIETMCADSLSSGSAVGGFPDERAIAEWQKAATALWEAASLGRSALTSSEAARGAAAPPPSQLQGKSVQGQPLSGRSHYAASAYGQRDRSASPAPSLHSSCSAPQARYGRHSDGHTTPRDGSKGSKHSSKPGAQAGANGYTRPSTYGYSQPSPTASAPWTPQQQQPQQQPHHHYHHPPQQHPAPPTQPSHLNGSCLASPGPGQSQPLMAPSTPVYAPQHPSPWPGASYGDPAAMGQSLHCLQPGHFPPPGHPGTPHRPHPHMPPQGHPYAPSPYPGQPPHPFALNVPPIIPPPTPFARPYTPGP